MPRRRLLAAATSTTLFGAAALAQSSERRVVVTFDSQGRARFDDTLSEFEVVAYAVTLRSGQSLELDLASSNTFNCFDIHAPGVTKPVYVGADGGNRHVHVARVPGEHLVKVYLLRLAARDGQSANYTLALGLKD